MRGSTVTIIAYHALGDGPGPLCVAPSTFRRQIGGLVEAGSTFLGMDAVVAHLRTSTPFPPRAVALSFDDAYESVHRKALPVLDAAGIIATVFPVSSQLGGHNHWDAAIGKMPELPLVSRPQLHELVSAGWEVGGHTHTHRPLPSLTARELDAELATSNAVLEDELGRRISTFAYPYGRHDRRTRGRSAPVYDACLAIGARRAHIGDPLDRLGRVDAWYLQRAWQVGRLSQRTGDLYLGARRLARAARGMVVPG